MVRAAGADDSDQLGGWYHGADCAKEPPVEVRTLEEDFYVLRQSLCTSSEGNFIYLLVGNERALLVDTGIATVNLREIVDPLLAHHKSGRSGEIRELIVAHTHAHPDHIGGDGYFRDRPDTTIVAVRLKPMQEFYDFRDWPNGVANVDLGGRSVQVIPAPGHTQEHIVFYDGATQTLLSGDLLMPGRLSFRFAEGLSSVERISQFAEKHPIKRILGSHIELNKDGVEYERGHQFHPGDEHALLLDASHLRAMRDALEQMKISGTRIKVSFPDFIMVPQ